MASPPFSHIGIIVPNLERAIEAYSRLGLTFCAPRTVAVPRLCERGVDDVTLDLRVAFSYQGPPRWELLEAVGEGIYGPQHIGQLHHVALADSDPESRLAELAGLGCHTTAAQFRDDGTMIVGYLDPESLGGIRIEMLDESVLGVIEGWTRGEEGVP